MARGACQRRQRVHRQFGIAPCTWASGSPNGLRRRGRGVARNLAGAAYLDPLLSRRGHPIPSRPGLPRHHRDPGGIASRTRPPRRCVGLWRNVSGVACTSSGLAPARPSPWRDGLPAYSRCRPCSCPCVQRRHPLQKGGTAQRAGRRVGPTQKRCGVATRSAEVAARRARQRCERRGRRSGTALWWCPSGPSGPRSKGRGVANTWAKGADRQCLLPWLSGAVGYVDVWYPACSAFVRPPPVSNFARVHIQPHYEPHREQRKGRLAGV
mmetsp:Transcript_55587/g.169049  ORF Transcript_55587/g.169049 Transcript_55587/m.169049 type:complete len:267 (-) Transcript_55587:124-924(-)